MISYRVKDIFKRIVKAGKIDFKTSGDFAPSYVDLPEMPDLGAGTYAVEADLRTADFKNTLYYRFTLMPFMTGAFKHRRLFCGSMGYYIGTTPRDLEAMAKAGVGSQIIFQPPTKALRDLLKVHDMLFSSTIFSSDGIDTDNFCHNFMSKYDLALPAENGILSVKDEALPLFEERAYRFAKRNPEVKYWKLVNEPVHNRDEEVKRSIEVLAHTCKGIRRATPDAVIFTPDPPGIGPIYLHKFWNMGGKDLCDAVATHPYRVHPESPDLDKDIADLLKGLPKNVPVYFTEGNYFGMYELPENSIRAFGNDKTLCNDFYRAGHFTYDIGLGELAAVAHRMRYRLQVMKYADRVLWDDDWGLHAQTVAFGLDVVPNGILFSVNTLASLLGNADFKSDIVFGEPIRCYLFEDDQRRPVAVIWNYNGEIFQRPEMVSKLDLSGMKEKFEVFNLMGAKEKVPRDNLLPVDGCPLFLRGEPGKTAEFQKQLGALDMVGGTAPDFKIETSIDKGRLNMRIRNVRAKDKAGLLTITADGEELLSRRVELPAAGEFPFAAEIPASAALQRMKDVITLKADGKSPVEKVYELEYFDVKQVGADFKADGTLDKWRGIAPVKLSTFVTFGANPQDPKQREYLTASVPHRGDKDLSAEIRAAYNKDFLHLLVKVTDDVYHPVDTPVAGSYNGDGLQIYFDSFADARNVEPHGFGDDDQAYDIRCLDGKTVEASRSYAPYAQLAFTRVGVDKSVQGTFKKTEDGYLFDLAFPLRAILPIELVPGKGVGISILVNDNDNDYRKRGVQLNRGAEPFQRPELYPVMMFK